MKKHSWATPPLKKLFLNVVTGLWIGPTGKQKNTMTPPLMNYWPKANWPMISTQPARRLTAASGSGQSAAYQMTSIYYRPTLCNIGLCFVGLRHFEATLFLACGGGKISFNGLGVSALSNHLITGWLAPW